MEARTGATFSIKSKGSKGSHCRVAEIVGKEAGTHKDEVRANYIQSPTGTH